MWCTFNGRRGCHGNGSFHGCTRKVVGTREHGTICHLGERRRWGRGLGPADVVGV